MQLSVVSDSRSVGDSRRGRCANVIFRLARSTEPNSVCSLRIRGARSGRRPRIVRASVGRVLIGRVGRRHVCMLELLRRRPDVRTLATGDAFAHRRRAVDALDPERARLGSPERDLEGRSVTWKAGFENELMAPRVASRLDFALHVARRRVGSIRRFFHPPEAQQGSG
jgi:hypothetical protein